MKLNGRTTSKSIKLIVSVLILGIMFSLIGKPTVGSAATYVIAFDDGYTIVKGMTLTTPATLSWGTYPGVLNNDYHNYTGTPLTATVLTPPSHGTLVLQSDGNFTYTPTDPNWTGIDSFEYTVTNGSTSDIGKVYIPVKGWEPVYACLVDSVANDVQGQGDVTQACQDISPYSADDLGIKFSFDEIFGTGSGNTRTACAFFDTNGNGNADDAVCISILSQGPNNVLVYNFEKFYSCSSDSKPDSCGGSTVIPTTQNYCALATTQTDPFPGVGDDNPFDATVLCTIPVPTVINENASFINACAMMSDSPTSNAVGCVGADREPYAFLSVLKIADPSSSGQVFNFSSTLPAPPSGPSPVAFNITSSGASNLFLVKPTTFNLAETIPAGWALTDAVCKNQTGATEGTWSGTTVSGIVANSGDNITCTFTNKANIDLTVTKSDGDYTRGRPYLYRGDTYDYTIDVEYTLRDSAGPQGIVANNVVMTDTLDPNVEYLGGGITVTRINGMPTLPSCSISGQVITCSGTPMVYQDKYRVSFPVTVKQTAPLEGLIETGTCWSDSGSITGWTGNLPTTGTGPVDLCNIVSVSTTSYEAVTTNNSDSEPADVGFPTAVDLISFKATGLRRSILLNWVVGSETDTLGYNLYRSASLNGPRMLITKAPIFANGGPYEYKDSVMPGITFYYWLESIDLSGGSMIYDIVPSAKATR